MKQIEDFDNMYRANNSVVDFVIPFPYTNTSEVLVYVRTVSTGVDLLQTESTDYDISGNICTFVTAPLDTEYVFFLRSTPLTQETAYDGDADMEEQDYEESLDKIVMQFQEIQKEITRLSSWLKNNSTPKQMVHAEADTFIGWDENGDLCNYPVLEATASIASQAEAEAGTENTNLSTPLRDRQEMQAFADAWVYDVSAPADSVVYLTTTDETNNLILPSYSAVGVYTPDSAETIHGKDFYISPTASGVNAGRIDPYSGSTIEESASGALGINYRGDFAHILNAGTYTAGLKNWSVIGKRTAKNLGATVVTQTWSANSGCTNNFWKDGNNLVCYGYISVTGAIAATLEVTIPYSLNIWTGWHSTDPYSIPVGELTFWDNSATTLDFGTIYISSTSSDTLKFYQNLRLGGDNVATNQTLFNAAINDKVWFYFEVPIVEFYTGV